MYNYIEIFDDERKKKNTLKELREETQNPYDKSFKYFRSIALMCIKQGDTLKNWGVLPLGVTKKIRLKSVYITFASEQKKVIIH